MTTQHPRSVLFDLWKHWTEYEHISDEELNTWIVIGPDRPWHCIFCGRHGTLEEAFTVHLPQPIQGHTTWTTCPFCNDHKGVTPCIEAHCTCWELYVVRTLVKCTDCFFFKDKTCKGNPDMVICRSYRGGKNEI